MLNQSSIGKAAIIITIISLLSRVIGFFREILFANYYGTNNEYEIYLVASIIPLTINTISIYFYQNYFIPNYAKIKTDYSDLKDYFVKKTFFNSVIYSALIVIIFIFFSQQILSLYVKEGANNENLKTIFTIFSLTIFPAVVSSFLSSYLNSKNKFSAPAFSLLFINLITILALIYFKSGNIIPIAIGYLIGSYLQLFYLLFKVDLRSIFNIKTPIKKDIIHITYSSVLSILLIELIGQLYVIADRYFYSSVDSGGIAALNYATNIFLLPVSIFTISLTTAIMPKISELSASNKISDMSQMLNKLFSLSFYFFIPVILSFILFGDKVVRIFFQRGSFDSVSTQFTYQVLFYLSLSFIFYVSYGVLNKFLYSLRKTNYLLFLTVFVFFCKILFNIILVTDFKQNGLAISTALSFLIFFSFAFVKVKSELKFSLDREVIRDLLFYSLNTMVSLIISLVLIKMLEPSSIYQDIFLFVIFIAIYYLNNQLLEDENQKAILSQLNILKR